MKRDMDLVREILLGIEQRSSMDESGELKVKNRSSDEINYHLIILSEAGLIEVEKILDFDETDVIVIPLRLTWSGHEFLAAARDDTRWNKAKEIVQEKGGGMMVDVLKGVLTQLARQAAGLP